MFSIMFTSMEILKWRNIKCRCYMSSLDPIRYGCCFSLIFSIMLHQWIHHNYSKMVLKSCYIKGTVPRDFLPLVFFFKQLLLAPVDKPSNDFDFFRIFAEIFDYFNDTGKWHFYCFRELHRCHWHRRCMHLPVSMTPAKHVFAGVNDTGKACHRCCWNWWRHASCITGVIDTVQ